VGGVLSLSPGLLTIDVVLCQMVAWAETRTQRKG
jgi:hypothetical protein